MAIMASNGADVGAAAVQQPSTAHPPTLPAMWPGFDLSPVTLAVAALSALLLALVWYSVTAGGRKELARATLTGIYIYPVKSCGRVLLSEAVLTPQGLQGDRRYMVADEDGTFLHQRLLPQLATVQPELTADGLVLSAPGMPDVAVPLVDCAPGEGVPARVWKSRMRDASDQGEQVAAWLTRFLGRPARLLYMGDACQRLVPEGFEVEGASSYVSFADGFSYLLTNSASLADLNSRMPKASDAVPMSRFRPNFVVDHDVAWAEDRWAECLIGAHRFFGVKRCSRCVMTTVDQSTGEKGGSRAEPLATLNLFRRSSGGVYFGMNMQHAWQSGVEQVVRVGDDVRVMVQRDVRGA